MGYLVLARKYRPERFADMIGQEHIARVLGQAIEQGRTHHAYLFCGVRGLGKTSAARILARCLVCEQGPTATPCNVCDQCVAVTESRSVDVREIDGASHNSVDDIRALREQVHYLPQSARKKIYIIDEVHMLTTSAFNALLKTLEEPPEHVVFIFATTDPHKVLPTILSRVSRLDFRRVPAEPLAQHLSNILDKEQAKADPEALRIIAQAGEGSVRDSLTQMEKVLAFCADRMQISATEVRTILGQADPNALSDIVQAIFESDVPSILQKLDAAMAQGGDAKSIALGLLREFRNLMVLSLTQDPKALFDEDPGRIPALQARAKACAPMQLSQLFDRLMRSTERLDRAPSPRLALEMALMELAISPSLQDISNAIAQLSGGSGPGPGGGAASPARGPTPSGRAGSSSPRKVHGASAPSGKAPELGRAPTAPPKTSPASQSSVSPPASRDAAPQAPRETSSQASRETSPQAPRATSPQASREASPPPAREAPPQSALAAELWSLLKGTDTPTQPGPSHKAKGASTPNTPTPPAQAQPTAAGPSDPPPPDPPPPPSPEPQPAPAKASQIEQGQAEDAIAFEPSPSLQRWFNMLDQLREQEETMMLAMLSEAGLVELTDDRLKLCASSGNFSRQKLENKGPTQDQFFAWLKQFEVDPTKLVWSDETACLPQRPSWSLYCANDRKHHRNAVKAAAQADPRVTALQAALRGEIVAVRVLKDRRGQDLDPSFEQVP